MLYTWSSTEIPPKPSKNEVINMLRSGKFWYSIADKLTPFVSSIKPVIMLVDMFSTIPICVNIEVIIFKIPEFSKIDRITENKTTNPPIDKIEETAFPILLPKVSPISEIFNGVSFELNFVSLKFTSNLFFFQNLKQYPTVRDAKIWDINNINPICLFLNRAIPTVPSINKGPELFVKAIKRYASILEIIFCFFKLQTTFATTG